MKSITFARVLRVLAVLALILMVGELQRATSTNIEELFATEIVLIAMVILMTRIIEIQKSEQSNKPSGY
jgi:hypothetical protein